MSPPPLTRYGHDTVLCGPRSAPSKALDFFAFDSFKRLLMGSGGEGGGAAGGGFLQTFAAAGLAGVGAGVGS